MPLKKEPGIPGKRAIASLPDRSRVVQYYMLGLPIFAPSVAFLNAIEIMPHLFKFPVRTRAARALILEIGMTHGRGTMAGPTPEQDGPESRRRHFWWTQHSPWGI